MSDNIIQCRISLVKVENRFRKEFGDIDGLAASIAELGLLQPIGVDGNYRLVFGERRLRACQALGWEKIPARTVHLSSILKGELAENEFRKDFTHSERVAIGEAIEAELGNRKGTNQHAEGPENFPDAPKGDTRDLAAKAAGFGNGKTYEQAKKVTSEAAPELVQAMDEGRVSVSGAASLLSLPKEEQATISVGDKKAIQQASKAAKAKHVEAPGNDIPAHVLRVINAMDALARFASSEGMTPNQLADKFLADVDPADKVIADRLSATLPFMNAVARIAAEIEFEEGDL